MSTSNRSSAEAATAKAAKSAASAASLANRRTPERQSFALTGPSRAIDHDFNAARRDLADVKLADQWFAPHYATPENWTCRAETLLLNGPGPTAQSLGSIGPGEQFAVLEISGDHAWGYRERDSRVGYVAASALTRRPQ